jgi:hypothetical protein
MMKRRREVVLHFTPEDLLQFFKDKESIWYIKGKGIPDDAKVLRVTYDPLSNCIDFVMASETHGFGFEIAKYQHPPRIDLEWEAKGMNLDDYRASPTSPVSQGGAGEDRTRHSRS